MRHLSKKQMAAAGAAVAIVAVGAGSAFAYWTDSGTGAGSAAVGTSAHFAVTVDAPTGAALSPGGPVDTVTFTVKNNGSGHQKVVAATATVANNDGSTWTSVAGCSAADFSIGDVAVTAADLAPGATTTGSFTIQMVNNTSASQDGCKSATVPLYVSVS